MIQFQRFQSTPVITKGQTFDGFTADALAAPSCCWDGKRFVLTLSLWSTSAGRWASAFFTSIDLKTWAHVLGSLRVDNSKQLLGNGGVAWFTGKYYFAYNKYSDSTTASLWLDTSTDLVNWTNVSTSLLTHDSNDTAQLDPSLRVNPVLNRLELWYIGDTGGFSTRHSMMAYTYDGVTWAKAGIQHTPSTWNITNYGEPDATYIGGYRHLLHDGATENGKRYVCEAIYSADGTTYTSDGSVLGAAVLNTWESVNVFDATNVGVFDRGDGLGVVQWILYAGSDIVAATDNTDSSIGLAYRTFAAGSNPTPIIPIPGTPGSDLVSALSVYGAASQTSVNALQTTATATKAKTDLIGTNDADSPNAQAVQIAVSDNLDSKISTIWDRVVATPVAGSVAAWLSAIFGVKPDNQPAVDEQGRVITANPATPSLPSGLLQTITVTNASGGAAIEGAIVRYAQAGVIKDEATAGTDGVALIAVPAGTYTRTVVAAGFGANVTAAVAVSADASVSVSLTALAIETPADPALCMCSLITVDASANVVPNATVTVRVMSLPDGYAVPAATRDFTSDANGLLAVPLIRGGKYRLSVGGGNPVPFTVPDESTYLLGSVIGKACDA